MTNIDDFLADLEILYKINGLTIDDRGTIKELLKTKQAIDYIDSFILDSKPEEKLNTHLFHPCLTNPDYLSLKIEPQVKTINGWVDYLVQPLGYGNPVAIELKPLHKVLSGKIRINKLESEYNSLRSSSTSENQIIKYLRDYHYVLLTNMETVYYFNRECLAEFKEFHKESFAEFINDLRGNPNIWDVARKKEDITVKQKRDLDKSFFADLSKWYQKYDNLKFVSSVGNRSEKIVQLINKFIFLKTLEDYSLIPFNYIVDTYEDKKKRWGTKGPKTMFREFFNELNKWAYAYYDTELFEENIFDYIEHDNENLKILQEATDEVLGTSNWNKYLSFGLLSYNYRGIDEDIFGKSYETFLAVGRKEHGIYYTPALITNYMSDLLVTRLFSELKDRLLKAVNEEPRDFKLAHQLVKIINNIKIADIAGGSGSFLVKILRAIWLIYMELQEKTVWSTHREALFDPLSELKGKVGNIRKMLSLGQEYFDERKALASVILKHLYMVDIDERAVDVAKANIWKEAVKIAPKSFRYAQLTGNIEHVLPNLELNFIVANSLVDIPLVQCLKIIKDNFKEDIVRLHTIRKSYLQDPYNTTLIESAIDIKKKIKAFLNKAYADLKYMINVPPLFPPLEFFFCYFDEHGDFLEEGEMGFDGTIGNPPYVRHESIQEIKPFLAGAYESFYCGTADLYTYFYKRCTDLLKYGGYLCYITPNKFMRAAYGENTRILLTTTTTPLIVIDFNDLPIFEEATTYPAILFVEKLPPRVDSVTKVATFSSMEQVSVIKETIETIGFNMPVSALKPEYWILKKPDVLKLMEKLRKMGTPLGEYVNGKIYRGILTGLNEAFVINTTTRTRLIDEEPGSVDLIEPWLRGRDIRKWKATWAELYFINIHSSANHKWIWSEAATEKEAEYLFMEAYPAVYRHLSKWKKQLQKRDDQGKFWWELRSCAYYDAFEQPKIIYPDIAQAPKFTWDESGAFLGNTAYIIPSDEKWLVGLLNSHLVWWFYKNVSSIIQGGYVRFIAQYMESIPIPSITDKQKISIIDRVQKILSDPTNIGVSNIESEINDLIYTLYDLTSEEIKLIKENSP